MEFDWIFISITWPSSCPMLVKAGAQLFPAFLHDISTWNNGGCLFPYAGWEIVCTDNETVNMLFLF